MCSWGFDEYYSIYMLLLKINESLNFMKNQSNVLVRHYKIHVVGLFGNCRISCAQPACPA